MGLHEAPDAPYQILFTSFQQPYSSLFSIEADGGAPAKLSQNLNIYTFAPSPNGSMIAFMSSSLERLDLFVVNTNGTDLHKISATDQIEQYSWTPDGRHLDIQVGLQGLYRVEPHATEVLSSTKIITEPASSYQWSPQGSEIYFMCEGGICVTEADGSNLTKFPVQGDVNYLTWSPTAPTLAFFNSNGATCSLSVLDVSDGSVTAIVPLVGPVLSFLDWSPDGSRIAFSTGSYAVDNPPCPMSVTELAQAGDVPLSPPPPNYTTYIVYPDGSDKIEISYDGGYAVWSPDSSRLVLRESTGLSVLNADGSDRVQLVHEDEVTTLASWAPDGSRLLLSGPNGLEVVSADGKQRSEVENTGVWSAQWSPDGRHISYLRSREGVGSPVLVDVVVKRLSGSTAQ